MTQQIAVLIAAVPLEDYFKLEHFFKQSLYGVKGFLERQGMLDVWWGFIKGIPYRVSYNTQKRKTVWLRCDPKLVKKKLECVN